MLRSIGFYFHIFAPNRVITIGSASDRSVNLEDPTVSPRHAIIYVQKGKVFVADDGGRGGVKVNGRVVAQQQISGFDEIEVGSSQLKIEIAYAQKAVEPSHLKKKDSKSPDAKSDSKTDPKPDSKNDSDALRPNKADASEAHP